MIRGKMDLYECISYFNLIYEFITDIQMLLYSQLFWVGGIYIDGFASNDQYLYAINFLYLF